MKEEWITKYWLPLLLILLAVALFLEFGTVKTIDFDSRRSESPVNVSKPLPPRKVVSRLESRLAVGERYSSLADLVADQETAGYVRTGYFGKHWPATVNEIQSDDDGISFVRQGGTKHNYTKFDGYRMKMVRLRAGNKETIVVFRSAVKK